MKTFLFQVVQHYKIKFFINKKWIKKFKEAVHAKE